MKPCSKLGLQVVKVLEQANRFHAQITNFKYEEVAGIQCDVISMDYEIQGIDQDRDYEIRTIEPLTLFLANDMPPIVKVRDDFPVVPHLNINHKDKQKTLCLFDLPYRDIQMKINGAFLLFEH